MTQKYDLGIFDSGVGGLSVFKEINILAPDVSVGYFADQIHVPYGSRSMEEIRKFSSVISRFLIDNGVQVIVVACNTASAAALQFLRKEFPSTSFVGMEPAIKPAAEKTLSGVVGVLATPATFQGPLYSSVVERFGRGVTILQSTCPGLVQQIEKGEFASTKTRKILEKALYPMMKKKVDTIVLGCTHYPFVIPLIQNITGGAVRVIDPAPAVAKQTIKLLEKNLEFPIFKRDIPNVFFTSGDKGKFKVNLSSILGEIVNIQQARWIDGKIINIDFCSNK